MSSASLFWQSLNHNCNFTKLTTDIISQCRQFSCKNDCEIEKFFRSEFDLFEKQLFAKSYGFITKEETPQLVCAFSVSNSLLPTDNLPSSIRNRINRKIPNSKRKSQHPAVLVGQLSVFDEFSHRGIADELISFIMSWALDPNNKFACRYILVDATNDPHVLDFYLRNGFLFLFDTVEEELDCLDLEIRPEAKRTRLMYFDLIKLTTSKL